MTAIGEIVSISKPDRLWKGQRAEIHTTIKNVGDTAGTIYFRMLTLYTTPQYPEYFNTGVQSVFLQPNETFETPLWDFETQEFFRILGTNTQIFLQLWHTEEMPPISDMDDSESFIIHNISVFINGSIPDYPERALEGYPVQIRPQVSTRARNAEGISVFMRVINLNTGDILISDEWIVVHNQSRYYSRTITMPNTNLSIRIEVGIINAYNPDTDEFEDEMIVGSEDITIILGEPQGEGRGSIYRDHLIYPEKVTEFKNFTIEMVIANMGEVMDTIFGKIRDVDTGEVLYEYRKLISINSGWIVYPELTMPDKNLNLRVEAGHEENGSDVIDDTEEFTIESFMPAYINIDTTPVKGIVYVDGYSVGIAPVTTEVESGTHTIEFGYVNGYETPESQTVTVEPYQTVDVIAEYVPSTVQFGFPWWVVIPIGLTGVLYLLSKKKKT